MNIRKYLIPISAVAAVFYAILSELVLWRINSGMGRPLFYAAMGMAIFMIPPGIERRIRNARVADARRRISDFLRDLSEYTMYGTPLSEAILLISRNDYGALNGDIRELVSSISIGTPAEEALRHFGSYLRDPEIERFGIILQKSGESGSNTSDVISLVSKFSSQMQLLTDERNAEMKNYNLILMVSFAVFLFVIVIIDVRFFDSINIASSSSFLFQSAGKLLLKQIFDTGIYIEALGIGLIIGLIRDRHLTTGFMEAGGMLMISALILLIVGGL